MARPTKEVPNRKDGRYVVTITIDDALGRKVKKYFYSNVSKADAIRQRNEFKVNFKVKMIAETLSIAVEPSGSMTFQQCALLWLNNYKKGSVKENTYLDSYYNPTIKYIVPYLGDRPINSIKPIDIKILYGMMSEKYSESTLHKIKLCLNSIYKVAQDNEWCTKNPAQNIKYSVKVSGGGKRSYTAEQAEIIEEFAYGHKYGIYILLLLKLGLRCSELCGLKYSDFDFANNTIHIQRAVMEGKGGPVVGKTKNKASNAVIPVYSRLMELIKERQKTTESEFILTTSNGKLHDDSYFTKTVYSSFFRDLQCQYPDIPKYTPHELRHTCGTLLYEKTKDIYAVSKFLRHASVEITAKIYVHEKADTLKDHLGIV